MKYRCKTEPYRHFRGKLFLDHQPTEINDHGTLVAISNHPDFERVSEKHSEKQADECPKCGRIVKRGKVMHSKWCKGK